MHYLIFAISALIFGGGLFIFSKKIDEQKRPLFEKGLALFFVLVFVARYYFYREYAIDNIIGLENAPDGKFITVIAVISIWFSSMANSLIMLKPFFKVDALRIITKYFCVPAYILTAVMLPFNLKILMGANYATEWGFTAIMYAIEVGLALAISAYEWFKDFKLDKPKKKSTLNVVFALVAMLICAIPSYAFQILFGLGNPNLSVDDFTVTHRIFIYMAFVIPVLIYFGLREKDYDTRRFALTYISVALMITFCTRFKFDTFLQPWAWPLHLCNTAMFLVPICLIFNAKKLFYFTYFINVMGAFLAMAMPNYESACIFEWKLVNFWINHYPAFFMPLLLVALKIFERPKIKQFYYSMAAFFVYFILMLVCNAWFTNYDAEVDFFFLNSTFIVDKFGLWAEKLYDVTATINVGNITMVFHPVYQVLFFFVYVVIALGIWFVYAQFFQIADAHYDMMLRRKKIRQDQLALASVLDGRSIEEPMTKDAGIRLELKKFSKRYATSKVYAVKDACLTVHGGEIFGFLGPNGAGKSTIIKSIVGIQPISEGAIEVCGYDCERQPKQAKSQIGFVPDHYALYEKLTGREYINYIADIYDVSQEDRNARIEEMVKLFELEGSFDSSMKTYSHGMKQKITIMAALVHNPKLWILDEPLTGLDPQSIFQVKECMRRHAEAGNIVFFSSHIIDVVERICDRIAIIKKGTIMCTKTIAEVEEICPLEDFYLKTINDEQFASELLKEYQASGEVK